MLTNTSNPISEFPIATKWPAAYANDIVNMI